jgi:hypothetical protein
MGVGVLEREDGGYFLTLLLFDCRLDTAVEDVMSCVLLVYSVRMDIGVGFLDT